MWFFANPRLKNAQECEKAREERQIEQEKIDAYLDNFVDRVGYKQDVHAQEYAALKQLFRTACTQNKDWICKAYFDKCFRSDEQEGAHYAKQLSALARYIALDGAIQISKSASYAVTPDLANLSWNVSWFESKLWPKITTAKNDLNTEQITELTKKCNEAEKQLHDLLPEPIANNSTINLKEKVETAHDILVKDMAKIIEPETQQELNAHAVKIKELSEQIETFEKNQ